MMASWRLRAAAGGTPYVLKMRRSLASAWRALPICRRRFSVKVSVESLPPERSRWSGPLPGFPARTVGTAAGGRTGSLQSWRSKPHGVVVGPLQAGSCASLELASYTIHKGDASAVLDLALHRPMYVGNVDGEEYR